MFHPRAVSRTYRHHGLGEHKPQLHHEEQGGRFHRDPGCPEQGVWEDRACCLGLCLFKTAVSLSQYMCACGPGNTLLFLEMVSVFGIQAPYLLDSLPLFSGVQCHHHRPGPPCPIPLSSHSSRCILDVLLQQSPPGHLTEISPSSGFLLCPIYVFSPVYKTYLGGSGNSKSQPLFWRTWVSDPWSQKSCRRIFPQVVIQHIAFHFKCL